MPARSMVERGVKVAAAAGVAAAAYMLFESQWVDMRERDLPVPGLPAELSGLTVLHISDVHAAQPGLNLWALRKVVRWAGSRKPDLVVLTGDIIDGGPGSKVCARLLARLRPPLGMFVVSGNHEYGLSKNPFTGVRGDRSVRALEGVTHLRDECVVLRVPGGNATVTLCGADYITRGHGLLNGASAARDGFPILMTHRPPGEDDPLLDRFPLVFAGHTHGGQIRFPTPYGMAALHREAVPFTDGAHAIRGSLVVISRGVGCTFLPFRFCCRPEATLCRLVPEGGAP